jgi:hypothetical protein
MMNEIHNTQSTTEELIVAYLDGELVRKELEIELFDRLATAPEARTLLREHLVMRGAIKQSLTDDRFQLSDDLDTRTRALLEKLLKSASTPAVLEAARSKRMADAPAISHNAAERRLQQWSKRPVALALLLLLTVGSTWYFTRATLEQPQQQIAANKTPDSPAQNIQPQVPPDATTAIKPDPMTSTQASAVGQEPKVIVRNVVRYVDRPNREMAQHQNNASTQNAGTSSVPSDPANMMLSRRAKAALQNSNTIVITEQDRI